LYQTISEEKKMKKQIVVIATLAVCLVLGTAAFAKSNIGFKGVGAKIGFISPEAGIGSTIGFGAVVDLGTITPEIALSGDVMYWSKSHTEFEAKYAYSQIYISGTAKYFFNTSKGAKFMPYAGAGLEFVIGKSKYEYSGPYADIYTHNWSTSNSELGFHIVGGAKYPLDASKYVFAEARYSMGGFNMFGIFGGIVFKLK
jgi:hypothetical protein